MNYRCFFRVVVVFFLLLTLSSFSQTKQEAIQEMNLHFKKSYHPKASFDSVLKNANTIIKLSKLYNLPVFEVRAYSLLGTSKSRTKEFEKSMSYFVKAKTLALKSNDEQSYYGILQNIASNHLKTSYHDSALYYFKKTQPYYKKHNELFSLHLVQMNMGNTYYYLNELDSAIVYLKKSTEGFKKTKQNVKETSGIPSERIIVNNLQKMGDIYFLKKEYTQAISYADSSLVLAKKINFSPVIRQNYNLLARSYKELGEQEKAARYFELESTIVLPNIAPNDAIAIQSRNAKSAIIQNKDSQERLYKVYDSNKFYKSSLFLSIVAMGFLGIIIFIIIRKKRKLTNDFKELQKELDVIQTTKRNQEKSLAMITLKSKAVIAVDDILFIKADDKYVEYYLVDKSAPEIDRNSLKEVEVNLPESMFVRVHRSYIVNIYKIKIINSTKLMLDEGTWINLSRTYKKQLKELLKKEVNY